MSYDTDRSFAYTHHGRKIRLYRYRASSKRLVDTEGRVSGEGWDSLIYPDETISTANGDAGDGLRIEYTALEKPFVLENPETTNTLTEVSSPKEGAHVNLNRMLSLAVVEFVKAQFAERNGNLEAKEYFMKQFYSKLSDNQSNKNRVHIAGAITPYAL